MIAIKSPLKITLLAFFMFALLFVPDAPASAEPLDWCLPGLQKVIRAQGGEVPQITTAVSTRNAATSIVYVVSSRQAMTGQRAEASLTYAKTGVWQVTEVICLDR